MARELRKPHFSHVVLEQASLHPDEFAVDLRVISLDKLEEQLSGTNLPGNVFSPNTFDENNLIL
ncbi:hypothetical protein ACFLTV_00255 [Chloroflexota bacterium]